MHTNIKTEIFESLKDEVIFSCQKNWSECCHM